MFSDKAEIAHAMWVFSGGAILVLLQSILSTTKRNAKSLIIGCLFGGAGSWIASQIWGDSKYVFIICGVAAVVTENLLMGVLEASQQFRSDPITVFGKMWRLIMPTFGKATGPKEDDEIK